MINFPFFHFKEEIEKCENMDFTLLYLIMSAVLMFFLLSFLQGRRSLC